MTRLQSLLQQLRDPSTESLSTSSLDIEWLAESSDEEVQQVLEQLLPSAGTRVAHERVLGGVFQRLRGWIRGRGDSPMSPELVAVMRQLYRELGGGRPSRYQLLQLLAAVRRPEALRAFAELMVQDPPLGRNEVALSIGPLFQSKSYDPAALFPTLWDAIGHLSVAAAVVDLCNYVTREGLVSEHPAAQRKGQLISLLGELVQRLSRLEEGSAVDDAELGQIARQVEDCVALAVALCDASALLGDTAAIGKLRQALDLRHRRLRTEAAGALARLGDESGRESLVVLASEPVCRLRVLAYAEELGLLDRVEPQHQTLAARAESDLALWLAQPGQMGIAPARLELIDQRHQFWPGFDDPIDCYLFRFTYPFPDHPFSNIGIAGPLTHAFSADLADLSPDDIYAAFAGWQGEHEEIFEVDVDDLDAASRVQVARLERRLRDAGYGAIEPVQLGFFFGERWLVTHAAFEGQPGVAAADFHAVLWYPSAGRLRPIGPHEAGCIYKGRKLLRSFNA